MQPLYVRRSSEMAPDSRKIFYSRLHAIALAARFDFDEEGNLPAMYERALAPLGLERVNEALQKVFEERSSRDPFPSVKEIKAVLNESLSPEDQAPQIAGSILKAISQVGSYQQARFRELVGEVGWRVIEMSGGLETVCQIQDREIGMHRAQWTRLAESLLRSNALKLAYSEAPRIEGPHESGLKSIGEIVKGIGDENK